MQNDMVVIVRAVFIKYIVISCTDVQSRCRKEQYDVLFHTFRNINGSLTLYLYVKYIINKYLIDEKNPFHGVIAPLILRSKIYFSYFINK